jgi:hypothetical protein
MVEPPRPLALSDPRQGQTSRFARRLQSSQLPRVNAIQMRKTTELAAIEDNDASTDESGSETPTKSVGGDEEGNSDLDAASLIEEGILNAIGTTRPPRNDRKAWKEWCNANGTCYNCGRKGHQLPKCPTLSKRNRRAINDARKTSGKGNRR